MSRKKVNDKFEFGLELNLTPYVEIEGEDCYEYELQTVLIHQGSAHGGHYHTYIRDVLNEGDWEQCMERFK